MTPRGQLTLTAIPGLPLVSPGAALSPLILEGLDEAGLRLEPGDVVALAQKIVSKAEGRLVALKDVSPSPEADRLALVTEKDPRLVELILRESRQVLRSRPGLLIVEHRLGFVCANAGVDQSNVAGGRGSTEEMALLLPIDPDSSAAAIRRELERASRARIGVVIIDSHGRPWREGAIGVAIGIAGMPGVLDLRGQPDLFGDPLQVTTLGLADEVAAAASLLMGQSDEGRPVVHLRGLPYPLREGSMREIIRPEEKDLFR